jgi:hypothetical protein
LWLPGLGDTQYWRPLAAAKTPSSHTQIARVRAPWVRECVFGHWGDEVTYIIPNREWVVIGGTGQVGDWRTSTDLGDAEAIMQRARQVRAPSRGGLTRQGILVGRSRVRVRPARPAGAHGERGRGGANWWLHGSRWHSPFPMSLAA